MPNQKNVDAVKNLTEKLGKAKSVFLTDYRGLTHQQLEQLRRALKKVEAEFLVAKNTLIKIALKANKMADSEKIETELNNPTATLVSYGDDIAAIKVLSDFIKKVQLPKVKLGLFGGKLATLADFNKLASLPTRDVLIATLAARLKSPIFGLHYGLKWNLNKLVYALIAVKAKKTN